MKKRKFIPFSVLASCIIGLVGCGEVLPSISSASSAASVESTASTESSAESGSSDVVSETSSESSSEVSSEASSEVSSESSSVVTTYSVSAAEGIVGGSISFDKASAEAGETVTVTVVTEEGYAFRGLSAEGVEFVKSDSVADTYTFVMPASDVVVSASFAEMVGVSSVKILSRASVVSSVSIEEGASYASGDQASFDVTFITEMSEDDLKTIYFHIGDSIVHASLPEDVLSGVSATVSFVVPSADFDVVVAYGSSVESAEGHTVSVEGLSDAVRAYAIDFSKTYSSVNFTIQRDFGHSVSKIEYKFASDEAWSEVLYFGFDNELCYTFSLPELTGDLTVRVTSEYVGSRSITFTNPDAVTSYTAFPSVAEVGSEVQITSVRAAESGKIITGAVISGIPEENIRVNSASGGSYSLVFTMPDADVSITFEFSSMGKVTIAESAHVTRAYATYTDYSTWKDVEAEYFNPGTYITVYMFPEAGYKITGATYTFDGEEPRTVSYISESYSISGAYTFGFTMPSSGNVSISLEASQVYEVSSTASELGSVSFVSDTYAAGESVRFTIMPSSGIVSVQNVTADVTLDDLTWSKSSGGMSYSGTFTMPESPVCLTVEYATIETVTGTLSVTEAAQSVVTEASFNGGNSDATVSFYPAGSTNTSVASSDGFLNAETLSPTVRLNSFAYTPVITVTDAAGVETRYESTYNYKSSGAFSHSFPTINTPESGDFTITVDVVAKEALEVTYDIPEGVDVTYTVDGVEVDTLTGNVFADQEFFVTVNTLAPEGKVYVVKIINSVGTELEASSGWDSSTYEDYYYYECNSAFTVKVELVDTLPLTINSVSNVSVSVYKSSSPSTLYSDMGYILADHDGICLTFRVNYSSNAAGNYRATIVVDGGEPSVYEFNCPYSWGGYFYYEDADGDEITLYPEVSLSITVEKL